VRDRPGVLDRPHGVALLGDTVLVACGDRPRRRGLQRFARSGTPLRPLLSGGDPEAAFGAPRAVWADADGVLVADTLHGRIQRFRADGTFVSHLQCTRSGSLARPVALLRVRGGEVLVVDAGDEPGVHLLGLEGQRRPAAALVGRVYVLDHGGERVVRFAADLTFEQVLVDLREHLDDFPLRS